jgi:hypothetical protein
MEVTLNEMEDEVIWGLTPSKQFCTTQVSHQFEGGGGVNNKMPVKIWKSKIPLNVRIFLWQAFQDRLQTGQQL